MLPATVAGMFSYPKILKSLFFFFDFGFSHTQVPIFFYQSSGDDGTAAPPEDFAR